MVTPYVTEVHRAGSPFEPARIITMRAGQIGAPGSIGGTRSPVKGAGTRLMDQSSGR
jgi:hypothetical protein